MKKIILFLIFGISLISCGQNGSNNEDFAECIKNAEEDTFVSYVKECNLKLLIPLYSYPDENSQEWQKLINFKNKYPDINITVIININNGHFSNSDPNYENLIQELSNLNINLIGYVFTKYSKRNINEAKSDIDNWTKFYKDLGINGIFFDEVSEKIENLQYYLELSKYAKDNGFYFITLNPGTYVDKSYINSNIANIIVNYEGDFNGLSQMSKWNIPTSTTSLAILVYGVKSSQVKTAVQKAVENNIKYIYLTDEDNTDWQKLSKYLDTP